MTYLSLQMLNALLPTILNMSMLGMRGLHML